MAVSSALTYPANRLLKLSIGDFSISNRFYLIGVVRKTIAKNYNKFVTTIESKLFYTANFQTISKNDTNLLNRFMLTSRRRDVLSVSETRLIKMFPLPYLPKDPDLLPLNGQRWPLKG
jgi:hypothetical protein